MKQEHWIKLKVLADLVAFRWLKNQEPSSIKGFQYADSRYDNGTRMGNIYTCEVLDVGPRVTQIKQGDLFVLHEYDKVNQGEGWDENEVLFCREEKILFIPDSLTEVTEREKDLTAEEEQEIVDVL